MVLTYNYDDSRPEKGKTTEKLTVTDRQKVSRQNNDDSRPEKGKTTEKLTITDRQKVRRQKN